MLDNKNTIVTYLLQAESMIWLKVKEPEPSSRKGSQEKVSEIPTCDHINLKATEKHDPCSNTLSTLILALWIVMISLATESPSPVPFL
jgi:hypothetical protein